MPMKYVYAALLLHSWAQPVNEENVKKIVSAAGGQAEESQVKALVAALSEVNIDDALKSASSMMMAPAAAPAAPSTEGKKKEEKPAEDDKKKEEEALAGLGALIGNPPTTRRYTVPEMRIQFMDYFADHGHARIPPYPIVARWRNDVYLVGASIYDFQPYVTEGTMPPPANPLVISQPCIRYTDVELVGPTGGRHMTIFEMGGAHAFNYPTKEVYWMDECVRYHHQLLTEVLGVPSESVTYKEHFWSGGVNAGPDLETITGGLEIGTLVFMQYRVQGDQLIQLPIRTVDTGYGIERWSWLSQGSPSGFHAVYGPALQHVMDLGKVSVDQSIIEAFTRASSIHGWASINKNRESYIQTVSEQTSISPDALRQMFSSLEAAYAITDHTKAAAFLLADGVVPSNVGEGYLARLIIRRAGRFARQLGMLSELPSIVDAQIKLWGGDFRTLREMRS